MIILNKYEMSTNFDVTSGVPWEEASEDTFKRLDGGEFTDADIDAIVSERAYDDFPVTSYRTSFKDGETTLVVRVNTDKCN